ncbi:hypothetical protein BWR17_09795 [Phaeobacter inhibens]|nr:hypothetical protein BWR17_09795 [Phaeobacter inhibens]
MKQSSLEYTPERTSEQLVAASRLASPKTVADFCAGSGNLLASARRRWPNADLYANDINPLVVDSLPNTYWSNRDFLSEEFDTHAGGSFPRKFDAILLNPPFSMERSKQYNARGTFSKTRGSVAFAFLFTALDYLNRDGELLAIMPTSTLKSERDALLREELRAAFKCRILCPPNYDRFPGLDVSTYLMSVRPIVKRTKSALVVDPSPKKSFPWSVTRGSLSVRRNLRTVQTGLHGWIHTTSIEDSMVVGRYELPVGVQAKNVKFAPKNSLVVPRVGKVKPGDLFLTKRREILSDCLLGVTFDDPTLARVVLEKIQENFSSFVRIYGGTGAPYTTQVKVSEYIDLVINRTQTDGPEIAREEEGGCSEPVPFEYRSD